MSPVLGKWLVLLLLLTSTTLQHSRPAGSCLLSVKAQGTVVVRTGQQLADALAKFGVSGQDTQIVILPPSGQQHISLEGVNFTTLSTLPDGSQPYSQGTVTIVGGADSPVIVDTAMRANITSPALSGSAKVHLGSNLAFVNLCESSLKLNNNDPRWVLVTAANLGLIPRSRTYRSQHHDSTIFYIRDAGIAAYLYFGLAQMSPFPKVVQMALPLLANLPLLQTSLARATDDPALYGLNSSYPGAIAVNVTYKAITHAEDPLVQWLNSTGRLMKPRFCSNGSEVPAAITAAEFSRWTGPLCMAGSTAKLRHCLAALADQTGQQRPVPVVMQLFNTSLTPDMLPGGVLNINGAMLLAGPVYLDDTRLLMSSLDFQGAEGIIQLQAGSELFLQQLVLTGLKQRSIPTGLGKGMPPMVSALPLAAIRTADSADAWSSPPAIVMHDCTLVLPDDDYLALLLLATTHMHNVPSLDACVDASTTQRSAAIAAGITLVHAASLDPSLQSLVLSRFVGWGINASSLTLQPQSSTAASQLQGCHPMQLTQEAADVQASADSARAATRRKLLGGILASVGVCLSMVAVVVLLKRHRSKQQRSHTLPESIQPCDFKQLQHDAENHAQQTRSWLQRSNAQTMAPMVASSPTTLTVPPLLLQPGTDSSDSVGTSANSSTSAGTLSSIAGHMQVVDDDGHHAAGFAGTQSSSGMAAGVRSLSPGAIWPAGVTPTRNQQPGLSLPSVESVSALQQLASFVSADTLVSSTSSHITRSPVCADADDDDEARLGPAHAITNHSAVDQDNCHSTVDQDKGSNSIQQGGEDSASEYHSCSASSSLHDLTSTDGKQPEGLMQPSSTLQRCPVVHGPDKAQQQQGRTFGLRMVRQKLSVLDAALMPSHVLLSRHSAHGGVDSSIQDGHQFKHLIAAKAVRIHGPADKVVLQGVLGRGAWGTVYAGDWRGLPVAVKTLVFELPDQDALHPHSVMDAVHKMAWPGSAIMETAIAASVGHRNLVSTYCYDIKRAKTCHAAGPGGLQVEEAFQAEGGQGRKQGYVAYKLLLVQELCGASLAVVLDRGALINKCTGRPDDFWVLCLLLDLAEGLQYLHGHNIVHGDLKPANILLKPDHSRPMGVVAKLADFGLSCYLAGASHVSNCRIGTPFHTAPEVVAHGRVSTAADMFSLGVIMWQLYTGQRPCVQDETGSFKWQPDFGQFEPGKEPCQACWDLEYRCLQHDAGMRPSAQEVVRVLRATLGLPGTDAATTIK